MSELKTFDSQRIYWAVEQVERVAGDIAEVHLDDNLFYLKSEADEVIRRQKYKRCLAMANWCFMKSNYHYLVGREEGGQLAKDSFRRSNLYLKWCDRWQRLAEQFKED